MRCLVQTGLELWGVKDGPDAQLLRAETTDMCHHASRVYAAEERTQALRLLGWHSTTALRPHAHLQVPLLCLPQSRRVKAPQPVSEGRSL